MRISRVEAYLELIVSGVLLAALNHVASLRAVLNESD